MTPPPSLQELIDIVRRDAATGDTLGQLVVAAAAAGQLEETADALLGHFVDRCRRDGRSWSEISTALGVTKQAVHKRFSTAVADTILAAIPAPTLERFTDRARYVVAAAGQAARASGHEAANSAHLLLGLFAEPAGLAGRALAAMNVSRDRVEAAIDSTGRGGLGGGLGGGPGAGPGASPGGRGTATGATRAAGDGAEVSRASAAQSPRPGTGERAAMAPVTFTSDAKRALRDALAVALEFGHNYIGTEHILLGLYRNRESAAARILAKAGAGAAEDTARAHISELLRGIEQRQ